MLSQDESEDEEDDEEEDDEEEDDDEEEEEEEEEAKPSKKRKAASSSKASQGKAKKAKTSKAQTAGQICRALSRDTNSELDHRQQIERRRRQRLRFLLDWNAEQAAQSASASALVSCAK